MINTNKTESSKNITSLAPKVLTDEKDIKKIQPYLSALKKTIDDDNISNIALTGAYGSGKSTIIKTFLDRNKTYKPLNISLATFKDEDSNNNGIKAKGNEQRKDPFNKTKNTERLIELSVLQQIFYHVNPSEIPDSRFKRIKSIGGKQLFWTSVAMIVWLVSVLFLFKYQYISKLNPDSWSTLKEFDFVALLSFFTFFLGIGFAISRLIRFLNGTSISKLNFLKGEMELGKNIEKSIFNEHLDEILYFFEATDYDVVIIEDLDRFNNTEIFTKLREINLLLNNSKSIKRKIVFLYAIREDKFHDKERIKFFDYIIPVIPFINPTNASDQLTKLIEDAGSKDDFSPDFIDSVTTYIDDIDMRLLTNIFHEYTIYKESLSRELIQDNLMAIIIYKNLEPKDFVDLSKNNGVLYTFLNNDKKYIKDLTSQLVDEVKLKKREILNIENEQIDSIEELKAIYINALHEMLNNAITIKIENEFKSFKELRSDDIFDALHATDNIEYEVYTFNSRYNKYDKSTINSENSFSDIEDSVNNSFSYSDRAGYINDKESKRINKLKIEIEDIRKRRKEIESWSLKQIFTKVDISPYLDEFANSKLLRNLIINGYINKNYDHYTTLFHEVNITQSDFDFERNVKNRVVSPYSYKLERIKNLMKRIPLKYFGRKEILNYDLFAFLLSNRNIFPEKHKQLFELLTNIEHSGSEGNEIFTFIYDYIFDYELNENNGNTNKNIKLFVSELSKHWDKLWNYIDEKTGFPKEGKDKFLQLIIKYSEHEDIMTLNENSELAEYISKSKDFLLLFDKEDYKKVTKLLKGINIKFYGLLSPDKNTKKLFDYVYKNNHYQINEMNLSLILKTISNNSDKTFHTSNFTTILKSEAESLITYIQTNIDEYIKEVMLKIVSNTKEDENVLLDIYNNTKIDGGLISELIKKQDTVISVFSKMTEESISPMFIEYSKIEVTWDNIMTYFKYSADSIDEILVDYLNKVSIYNELSTTTLNGEDDKFIEKFSLALINCNELTIKSYSFLLKSIPVAYSRWNILNFENLRDDKVEWLIDNNFLSLSVHNYDKLRKHFGLHIYLIEKKQSSFFIKYDELTLDEDDLLFLLESDIFTKGNKVKLIEKLEENEITDNTEVAKKTCSILANSKYIPLSFSVLSNLVTNSYSTEDRVKLINIHFEGLSGTEIKTLFGHLPSVYAKTIKAYGKPSLSNTSYNLKLADNLLGKGYISSRKIKKGKIKIYAFTYPKL